MLCGFVMPDLYLRQTPVQLNAEQETLIKCANQNSDINLQRTDIFNEERSATVYISYYGESFSAPDNSGKTILDFSYAEPRVKITGNEKASADINEYLAIANELYYSGYGDMPGVTAACEFAIDSYTYFAQTGEKFEGPFYSRRDARVMRADSSVVSILFTDSAYYGFGEETKSYTGLCYSSEDGTQIKYYNLSPDAEALNARVIQSINSDYGIAVNGYETALYFAGLSEEGIVLNIGGILYTAGYEKLENVIYDKFIPDDFNAEAQVELIDFEPSRQYSMEISDIVIADEQGADWLISFSGTAKNVRLTKAVYTDDGFNETGDIWFADCVSDCMIQVKMTVPEGLPELMLTYESSPGCVSRVLISQSGAGSSPILVSDEIKAVG